MYDTRDDFYEEDVLSISNNSFDTDFDNIAYEPVNVDDSDEEAAEEYDY